MTSTARIACLVPIVLFSIMPVQEARAGDLQAKDIVCRLDPKCPKLRARSTHIEERGVQVEGESEAAPLSVNLYVNFAFDSAEVTQDARITLDQLGSALRDPRLRTYTFKIAGHTDAKGTVEYNQLLSQRRAEAVGRYIITNFGIAADRLSTVGYGKSQLLDPSRPEEGVNRRVQVINVGENAP